MKTELTEAIIQQKLSYFLSSVRYDIDNLYVFRWESDKLIKTRSGYYYEFEIKISKSDFKNDFKHKKDKHHLLKAMLTGEKHTLTFYREWEWNKNRYISFEAFERIKQHPCYFTDKQEKPNYFYYAVPENMIAVEDVPECAGLIYVTEDGWLKTVKKAPLLHKEKYTDDQLGLGEKFYYNMVHWRNISNRYLRDIKSSRDRLRKELEAKGHDRTWEDMELDLKKAESTIDSQHQELAQYRRDLDWDSIERRFLIDEIKMHDPKFNVHTIWKMTKERYDEIHNQKQA